MSTEIREPTYHSILQDLRYLSVIGGLFKFSIEDAGYISEDSKKVLVLRFYDANPKFAKLIQNQWAHVIRGEG